MSKNQLALRVPELNQFENPVWFHHHGTKPSVISVNVRKRRLHLGSNATDIWISPWVTEKHKCWLIKYVIRQSLNESFRGQIIMKDERFKIAFGLQPDHTEEWSRWLLCNYGGHCASQGEFIRFGNFLNMPCPGTGHDGDPNISVYLDLEIVNALRRIMD